MIAVQLFDQPFRKVAAQLSRLRRLGVTHVLVSPPQKSHSSHRWWGRYQPVDFTRIEGPLGDANDLAFLCHSARSRGLSVVADAVLHHLSNEPRYVTMRGNRILSAQYPQFCAWDLIGVHRLGRGRGLPILDTSSDWVRRQLRNYLHWLFELGVRGFRFDSAKHLDPHLFPYLLDGLPSLLCFGELVYSRAEEFPDSYWTSMRAYDFPLAQSMRRALAPGGDLGALLCPNALPERHSVPFVNHHDLVKNRRGFADFRIPDPRDRTLAYIYMLTRGEGVPLLYGPDLRQHEIRSALRFHALCAGLPRIPLAASRTGIAFRRGNEALVAINKAGHPWLLRADLPPGLYYDLLKRQSDPLPLGYPEIVVPPRGALLLVSRALQA